MASVVEIDLFGPMVVRGLAFPFRRSSARELVAYLALHRDGVRNEVWSEALWPTRVVSQATCDSTVSDCRRALGCDGDGMARLVRDGRILRLADSVHTDVEQFARLASADHPEAWRRALGLVRGTLLEGMQLSDWAVFDGTQAQVESMVVITARKAVEYCLASGRAEQAEWAVRQGLRACPYDERLYRALLRATAAQGNLVQLRCTMAELRAIAGADQEGAGAVPGPAAMHPDTEALFQELLNSSIRAVGASAPRL
ncbi:MAG TPA: BTAD domain-containing putative transcriptional regulator [Acidimicrobiales bacterium]|jgi:DNA-binding SARP family transcriptional activator